MNNGKSISQKRSSLLQKNILASFLIKGWSAFIVLLMVPATLHCLGEYKNGIWLTGGGALLRGLDKRLSDKIKMPFRIAEDPLHSVAKGTGIALKNVNNFSFLMR